MTKQKSLHHNLATILTGGCLVAGSVQAAPLVSGSTYNVDVELNGSVVGSTAVQTEGVNGGFFNAGPPGISLMNLAPWPFASPNTADINFNWTVSGLTSGDTIDVIFSDLDFVGGEELTGLTVVNSKIFSGVAGGIPSFATTANGFTASFQMTSSSGSWFNAGYNFDTVPPASSVPIPAPLALFSSGIGLLAWRRRRS